ncbi:MAG: VWA domain-containing protein [Candidatus Bipolaricaulota bacterium]|nr:VWA domain-containing protein [Candidatus Bipolaricaulota bacterium]
MIHFGVPLVLVAIPVAVGLLFWLARGARRPILRALAVVALLVAVSDPRIAQRDPTNNVMFLVDRSASVTRSVSDRDVAIALATVSAEHPRWAYGIVGFAESATIEASLGAQLVLPPPPLRDAGSNVADALELALSALPAGKANQIVLLSDGRFTADVNPALAEAQVARVPISVVPLGAPLVKDARIVGLVAPAESAVGRPIAVDIEIESVESGPASLVLYRNGDFVAMRQLDLPAGRSTHRVTDSPPDAGFFEYKAVVKKVDDPVIENDTRSVSVRTVNHPSILVVDPRGGSAIPDLLRAVGLDFVTLPRVPALSTLADYRQLILVGQPLADLSERESQDLSQFVRYLGGGLLAVLGEQEVRGFSSGSIDDLLPISFTVPEVGQKPSLALIYLLDRSSSMNELAGAKTKIRTLREAAAASVLLLPSETVVGIIGFYDSYDWVFPLQRLGDGTDAYRAIASIGAFGGTDIYYPLNDAVDQLIRTDARVKQILLISDGQTTEVGRDYPGLLEKLDAHPEITVSAIGISTNPNVPFLTKIVEHGRGALYYASSFATLPQITMQVTQRLSRSRFVTGDIEITSAAGSLATIPDLPHLSGYVLTYPRAEAATLLWAGEDPIFSTWRTGLGSVSVLNADLSGSWTSVWLSWSGMPDLFDRLLQTTEPLTTVATGITTSLDVAPDATTLWIDARNARGAFENFLSFSGTLLPGAQPIAARQAAPGLYEATFPTPAEGAHAILMQEARTARSFSLPVSIPYSREYEAFGTDAQVLSQLATEAHGGVLAAGRELAPVESSGGNREAQLFPAFLGAALALFLADLALRLTKRRSMPSRD